MYSYIDGQFQTENVFTNVPGGTYVFTVVDSNGCNASNPVTVGVSANPGM